MDAALLSLNKKLGIVLPTRAKTARLDLETRYRLLEKIEPLLRSGHDDEARERANEWAREFNFEDK